MFRGDQSGQPQFQSRQQDLAIYQINHHGDGRIALWLNSPPGAQKFYVKENQTFYFVPPYVGPRGWLGLNLDKGLDWQIISQRIHEAYANVAPAKVLAGQPEPVFIEPPSGASTQRSLTPSRRQSLQRFRH